MNEKIKDLALQAGYVPLPGFDFANSLQEVFMQKFAKLIVQECARICVKEARQIGGRVCSDKIKEHFGVDP